MYTRGSGIFTGIYSAVHLSSSSSEFVGLSRLFLSARLSRVFTSSATQQLLLKFSWGDPFIANGCSTCRTREQKVRGCRLSQSGLRSWISELSYAAALFLCLFKALSPYSSRLNAPSILF